MGSNAAHHVTHAPSTQFVPTIQGAARCGYEDARQGLGFSTPYATQEPQWQRNYEQGRLWAIGMRKAGASVAAWPEKATRPPGFEEALDKMAKVCGSVVPREAALPDPKMVMHITVPRVRGRRIMDVVV